MYFQEIKYLLKLYTTGDVISDENLKSVTSNKLAG